MKIAIIAPSPVPFEVGGAENLWWGLYRELSANYPYEVELIKLPAPQQTLWELLASYRAFSELNLDHFDRIITTKYPAWMISHRHHTCYLQHKLRPLYDLYPLANDESTALSWLQNAFPALQQQLEKTPSKAQIVEIWRHIERAKQQCEHDAALAEQLNSSAILLAALSRQIVHYLDACAFSEEQIKACYTISETVKNRADYFPSNNNVEVIKHPSSLEGLHSKSYSHLFTVSRLEPLKRIDMLIEAYQQVKTDRQFFIAGTGTELPRLKALAQDDPRIVFLERISNKAVVEHYADALFVPFIPFDEDFGLVTIEAFAAEKAVLSTSDSGGVRENIRDRETGLIVEPTVESLAQAMQHLVDNPQYAEQLGRQAKQLPSPNWSEVIEALLG